MASEEEVVRFIFNGANEMAELMYQLIKWALERREKGRDDARRDPSKISRRQDLSHAGGPDRLRAAAEYGTFYLMACDGLLCQNLSVMLCCFQQAGFQLLSIFCLIYPIGGTGIRRLYKDRIRSEERRVGKECRL